MPNHIHMLIELSLLHKFTHFIRDLKSCSSLWIHKTSSQKQNFAWQEGDGSFSVSFSELEKVQNYIQSQETHHANQTFDQEYLKFLKQNKISYDDRFVLG